MEGTRNGSLTQRFFFNILESQVFTFLHVVRQEQGRVFGFDPEAEFARDVFANIKRPRNWMVRTRVA